MESVSFIVKLIASNGDYKMLTRRSMIINTLVGLSSLAMTSTLLADGPNDVGRLHPAQWRVDPIPGGQMHRFWGLCVGRTPDVNTPDVGGNSDEPETDHELDGRGPDPTVSTLPPHTRIDLYTNHGTNYWGSQTTDGAGNVDFSVRFIFSNEVWYHNEIRVSGTSTYFHYKVLRHANGSLEWRSGW